MSYLRTMAIWYAEKRGWHVFPLKPNRFEPLTQHGYKDASNDPAVVAAWWDKWPNANIGLALQQSGLMAADVDPRNNGLKTWAERYSHIDSTLKAKSAGDGIHYIFTVPEGADVKGSFGPGVDAKWRGYIILAPSERKGVEGKPDGKYEWISKGGAPASVMPEEFRLVKAERPERAAHAGDLADVAVIREALSHLTADEEFRGDNWVKIGMALHQWEHTTEGADEMGWELFEEWCQLDPSGHFDDDVRKRWDSFSADKKGGLTLGTLFNRASAAGWQGRSRLTAELAARVFGGTANVVAIAQQWLPADPEYRGETDGKAIAVRMLASDEKTGKLSKALQEQDLGYVAYSALFNSGRSCDVALEVVQTLMPEVAEDVAKAVVAAVRPKTENYRGRVERWDRAPIGEPVEVLPLELLRPSPITKGLNDHYADARQLQNQVFMNRLAGFDSAPYWWDGQMWQFASDALLRRFAGDGLADGEQKVTNGRITGTVAVLKDQLPIMGQINPRSVLVFFRNCVLNVVDGKVTPHNPMYRNSYLIGCDYDPEAACPQFEAWLHDIFETDRGRVGLLQEILGWCMITSNLNIQKAVTLVGAPRAGKGTILAVMTALLGEAAGAFQLPDLTEDKVLAGMMNRNVAIDYDAASPDRNTARQVVGRFKAITANEPIAVRLLYTQTPFQGQLNCKLVLAANSVPTLWDDSGASANRWVPLVFDKSFLGREDAELGERLIGELPGIAIWALEGLARLIERGKFTLPQSSLDELAGLVDSSSPILRFLEEQCVVEGNAFCKESELWSAYENWAPAQGLERGKRSHLIKAVCDAGRALGLVQRRRDVEGVQARGISGIRLKGSPPTISQKVVSINKPS